MAGAWLIAVTLLLGGPPETSPLGKETAARAAGSSVELSVSEAVQVALSNSFTVRIAQLDRTIREHQVEIEEAIFDPVFSAAVDYGKYRNATVSTLDVGGLALGGEVITNPIRNRDMSISVGGRGSFGTQYAIRLQSARLDQPLAQGSIFGINPQDRITASLELTQPLLAGSGREYNTGRARIARNNSRMAQHELELAASDFVFEVEVAYWQLAFAFKNFEAKKQALGAAEENFDNARKATEIGSQTDADVTVAHSQFALRKVEQNEARVLLFNSQDRLLVLLNESAMTERREKWRMSGQAAHFDAVLITPTSEPRTDPVVPDRGASYQTAFDSRPDYQAIAQQIESQNIQVALAKNEELPQLLARGKWEQYGLDGSFDQSVDSVGSGDFYGWSVGLEVRVPFQNRAAQYRHLQTQKQARQILLERERLESQIYAQVDQAIRTVVALFERVNDLDARVRLQRQLVESERKKLNLGRTTYYNVTVIENDVVESEALALRAKVEFEAAKTDYYRVTGTLLDKRGARDLLR